MLGMEMARMKKKEGEGEKNLPDKLQRKCHMKRGGQIEVQNSKTTGRRMTGLILDLQLNMSSRKTTDVLFPPTTS